MIIIMIMGWRIQNKLEKQRCCSYYSRYDEDDIFKRKYFELYYPQENMICHKQILPTKLRFHYISNWRKALEFYLMSFLNMMSWRVNFLDFLDFPVHYTTLFIACVRYFLSSFYFFTKSWPFRDVLYLI